MGAFVTALRRAVVVADPLTNDHIRKFLVDDQLWAQNEARVRDVCQRLLARVSVRLSMTGLHHPPEPILCHGIQRH